MLKIKDDGAIDILQVEEMRRINDSLLNTRVEMTFFCLKLLFNIIPNKLRSQICEIKRTFDNPSTARKEIKLLKSFVLSAELENLVCHYFSF